MYTPSMPCTGVVHEQACFNRADVRTLRRCAEGVPQNVACLAGGAFSFQHYVAMISPARFFERTLHDADHVRRERQITDHTFITLPG
jgi:hypothetical protein